MKLLKRSFFPLIEILNIQGWSMKYWKHWQIQSWTIERANNQQMKQYISGERIQEWMPQQANKLKAFKFQTILLLESSKSQHLMLQESMSEENDLNDWLKWNIFSSIYIPWLLYGELLFLKIHSEIYFTWIIKQSNTKKSKIETIRNMKSI